MSQLENQQDNRSAESRSAESVPEALVGRERWLCWQYEQVGDSEKKPPYDPKTGKKASIHDTEAWTDFETALERYHEGDYDGIGFVITTDDPFTGFDFDKCRDPKTGEIDSEIEHIIERLNSYTEISPSGEGLHTFVIGEKPDSLGSESGNGIEIYDSARYFTVTGNHLDSTPKTIEERSDELRRVCETYLTRRVQNETENEIDIEDIGKVDSEHLEIGEKALKDLRDESIPTFEAVMSFLQGGIADFNTRRLIKDDGRINRSGQDYTGISLVYRTLKRYLDDSEYPIKEITWSVWSQYCQNHPSTDDGQIRRWFVESQSWRKEIFNNAISGSAKEQFQMMVEYKSTGMRRENNEYSKMTYEAIWTALDELLPSRYEVDTVLPSPPHLYNDMDPANPATEPGEPDGGLMAEKPHVHELYPGKSEVIDRAYENDDGYNSWKSYEEAFRRLQSVYGEVKAARIGSSMWVYYSADYPDPPEACSVMQYGETYDPDTADGIHSWTGEPVTGDSEPSEETEQELMTDGGTVRSEATQTLERIRRARDGEDDSTNELEIFVCPVEGCSRTVIDDPSNLRSHVRQAGDKAHRYKTLNEDLEIELDEEALISAWGPGVRKEISDEQESMYSDYTELWGPGMTE